MSERCCHEYCEMMMSYCLGQDEKRPKKESDFHRCTKCLEFACDRWRDEALQNCQDNKIKDVVTRGKSRLMQVIGKAENRFAPLQLAFAKSMQMSSDEAHTLLGYLHEEKAWCRTQDKDIELQCFTPCFDCDQRLHFLRLASLAQMPSCLNPRGKVLLFVFEGSLLGADGFEISATHTYVSESAAVPKLRAGERGAIVALLSNCGLAL